MRHRASHNELGAQLTTLFFRLQGTYSLPLCMNYCMHVYQTTSTHSTLVGFLRLLTFLPLFYDGMVCMCVCVCMWPPQKPRLPSQQGKDACRPRRTKRVSE